MEEERRIQLEKEALKFEEEDFNLESCLIRNEKGKITNVDINPLVDYLMEKYSFKTLFEKKGEFVYLYNNGIYIEEGKEFLSSKSEKLLGIFSNCHRVTEIIGKIKRRTSINKDIFNEIPIELVCLENGIFNISTNELTPFDSDYYFKSKLPINYNKDSDCLKIKEFLEETCYPEDIPVIQEFLGFCLFRRYFIKKAIILFGEKNTGKTVLLNILSKFLGLKNISGISLQRIASKDKFALASLRDKLSNIYDDLSAEDLNDAGGVKRATGGGYITAEYKFGDSFQFMTFAKNIFATNKIPNVKEINDDAYYERWIPLCFDNQKKIEEQDNFLFEKITTKEEISGLFNWAIEGLGRLITNGKFSYQKTSEEIKSIMQRQNNPLVFFVDDCLEQQDKNKISKETMYRIYTEWCNLKKLPRFSKEQLGRNLAKYTNYIIAKGGNERIWENVKIQDKYSHLNLLY